MLDICVIYRANDYENTRPNRYYRFKHKEVGDYKRIVKETINTYLNVYEHSVVPEQIIVLKVLQNYLKK